VAPTPQAEPAGGAEPVTVHVAAEAGFGPVQAPCARPSASCSGRPEAALARWVKSLPPGARTEARGAFYAVMAVPVVFLQQFGSR
jgi:hypothetical protein